MNFFQIQDTKISVINEINGKDVLENPQQYIVMLAYKELAIMRVYLNQLAHGRFIDDAFNKCEVEWHKPLILLGATILAHQDKVCYNYVIHDSPYIYMQVAPKGQNHDALITADRLVMQQLEKQEVITGKKKIPGKPCWFRRISNALKRIIRTTC